MNNRQRFSAWAGAVARTPASRALIPWYAWYYRVATEEALTPPRGWANLQAFFTRRLKPGLHPVAAAAMVSPCDGTVGAFGAIHQDTLVQAKGRTYSLDGLLAAPGAGDAFHGGVYATIYLAPADYHRVHSPVDGQLVRARQIPGTYYSVNPRAVVSVPDLFTRNQRLICEIETATGPVTVVLVGACLVGGIRLSEPPPRAVARGDEIAWFEFGSTVVLLAARDVASELAVMPRQRVRMGEALI